MPIRKYLPFLLLLVLTAAFRYSPYHWMSGGQDQGVYVNMSSHFQASGQIFGTDALRESLPQELRSDYDRTNYRVAVFEEGEREGNYLPGVYLKDQDKSQYVFQFYHLHPLFMALFAEVFGDNGRFYSTVFFGLLSILGFSYLAFEFTGSRLLAWSTGALLAVNPLHAFFSKFPVTEVVALAFSSWSFYFLLRYYNLAKAGTYSPALLAASLACISGLFFTRISGFMYLPFFYLLLLAVQLYANDQALRRQLSVYIFSVFAVYALSVWYGLTYSYPYASDIYRLSFTRVLGQHWQGALWAVGVLAATGFGAIAILNERKRLEVFKSFTSWSVRFLPLIFLVLLLLGGYKAYQLGFTTAYVGDAWHDQRWGAAGTGWRAFLYWSPVVLLQYLSPFIVALFIIVAVVQRKTASIERQLLLLFILFFFAYICILQWFIPYQYYYARYLLSEVMPYSLLFAVIGISALKVRKSISYGLLVLAGIYMTGLSATQFKVRELEGFEESLDQLKKYLEPGDVLLTSGQWLWSAAGTELKTPLTFYYGYKVLSTDEANGELFLDYYCSIQDHVFYLGNDKTQGLGRPHARFEVRAKRLEHTPHIPTRVIEHALPYSLFKVNCEGWNRYRASLK